MPSEMLINLNMLVLSSHYCLVACEFESKWKIISRKLPHKKNSEGEKGLEEKCQLLLQHRHASMEKLKHSLDCGHLYVDWRLSP